MTPEQIEQLIRELMETGEILATGAYEIAVRQVYVEVWQNFAGSFILALIGVIAYKVYKHGKNLREESYSNHWELPYSIGAVVGVVSPLLSLIFLSDAISRLLNPEWYAVKILLETFVGK